MRRINMAEDFIEELYDKAETILAVKKCADFCKTNQYQNFNVLWKSFQEKFADYCRGVTLNNENLGEELWTKFVEISKYATDHSRVKVADLLEDIVPLMYEGMAVFGSIDVVENDYRLFSSRSGFLSLQKLSNQELIVSSIDPAYEAYKKACELFKPSTRKFCTLGCEMGYLCWQIYEVSNQSIDIYIYEKDELRVEYALRYGALSKIPKDRLHIYINSDSENIVKAFSDNMEEFNSDNVALNIETEAMDRLNREAFEVMKAGIVSINTTNSFYSICEQNFFRNRKNVKKMIDDLKVDSSKKEWIIVGGGPSVDDNLDYLKDVQGKKIIIVVTTIYNRLLSDGIRPDYVVALDPQNRTYGHMKGVIDTNTPLLMMDTANWMFGELYGGDKYLIPSDSGYYSEEIYNLMGIKRWENQGTVSGLCIDIAVNKGAEQIELIGLDLSYPFGNSHAGNTMDRHKVDEKGLKSIRGVDGNDVLTSEAFDLYRKEIERQIDIYASVKFYNRSKHGAFIKGCVNI